MAVPLPARKSRKGILPTPNGGRIERGGSDLEPPHFLSTDAPELGESPNPPGIPAGRRLGSEPYLTATVVLTVPPFTDE
jgi:hypothetical protein